MPEGHTIHRLARDLGRDLAGQKLTTSSPQGRFADGARTLSGRTLEAVEAYGKHLFFRFSGRKTLHVHLGLYGKFRRHKAPLPEPRGQVRLRACGDSRGFDLNGPTACDLVTPAEQQTIFDRLGQDPLRPDADPGIVRQRVRNSRAEIGRLLLDQSVFPGVGNIYRAELLHIEQIHPTRLGNSLSSEEFDGMWDTLTRLLKIGVRYNKIITSDPDEIGRPHSKMRRQERLRVYGKQLCTRCGEGVDSWTQAARTIYACPNCQR